MFLTGFIIGVLITLLCVCIIGMYMLKDKNGSNR